MDILQKLDELNRLPFYRLTLNSMENSHSEMLQFLFEWYPQEAKLLLCNWMNTTNDTFEILESRREKDGRKDLLIKYSTGLKNRQHKMIIENKVKALPTRAQLVKYSAKKPYSIGLLLSLSRPSFMKEEEPLLIGKINWYFVSYHKLRESIRNVIPSIEVINRKDAQYLNDYLFVIDSLLSIPFDIKLESEFFDFTDNNPVWVKLKKIRLHDVYSKNKYQQLALKTLNQIRTFYHSATYSQQWVTDERYNLFLNDGFASGSALFDVKYRVAPGLCIGIQIHGMSFRLFVDGTEETQAEAKSLAHYLLRESKWFSFCRLPNHESLQIYPIEPEKIFNGYGKIKKTGEQWFFYQSVNLEPLLMGNLIELVVAYTKDLLEINLNSYNSKFKRQNF